jgi:hypothetical protein
MENLPQITQITAETTSAKISAIRGENNLESEKINNCEKRISRRSRR